MQNEDCRSEHKRKAEYYERSVMQLAKKFFGVVDFAAEAINFQIRYNRQKVAKQLTQR